MVPVEAERGLVVYAGDYGCAALVKGDGKRGADA